MLQKYAEAVLITGASNNTTPKYLLGNFPDWNMQLLVSVKLFLLVRLWPIYTQKNYGLKFKLADFIAFYSQFFPLVSFNLFRLCFSSVPCHKIELNRKGSWMIPKKTFHIVFFFGSFACLFRGTKSFTPQTKHS